MFQTFFTRLPLVLVLIYKIIRETNANDATCETYEFECMDKNCILASYQCNGHYDCLDGSDEESCKNRNCNMQNFKCESGHCIQKLSRCNGLNNCLDKSDELNCSECSTEAFACHRGGCISKGWTCDSELDCLDGSDEAIDDCHNRFPNSVPDILESYWDKVKIHSSLAYVDDPVAVYYDDSDTFYEKLKPTTGQWSFELLGKTWDYVKKTYKPLHIDFRLSVILTGIQYGPVPCSAFSSKGSDNWGYPNSIQCRSYIQNPWSVERKEDFESVLSGISQIIQQMRQRKSLSDYSKTCEPQMLDVIFYDLYIYIKGSDFPQLLYWKADKLERENSLWDEKIYCFRDWYFPIYEAYGGSEVLSNYFSLMLSYLKKRSFSYDPISLNNGEFLHVWSEAVGTDLKYLYEKTIKWTLQNERELKEAKESYHLNYTLNSCHLAYIDQHVGVYFFSPEIFETPFIKILSDGWKYIKENYGPFTDQSLHTLIVQYKNITLLDTTCTPLNNGFPKKNNFVTVINRIVRNSHVDENVFLDKALTSIAQLTLDLTQKTGIWPGCVVSGWTMNSIIVYDIYVGLGLNYNEKRWKKIQLTSTTETPTQNETFWFRDWYLRIYETSHQLDSLKSFVSLLNTTWDRKEGNLTKQLNMGQFVHFWSGAAGRSLLTEADISFGWNLTFQDEFIQARKDFINLNYSCTDCEDFRWKSYIEPKKQARVSILPIIIIGAFLVAFAVASTVCLAKLILYKKRIRNLNSTIRSLTAEDLDEFLNGNPNESTNDVNARIFSIPYNTDYELSMDRLIIDQHRVLGSGEFGFVFHGILKGDQESGTADVEVAVKAVKPNVEISYFKALLSEIKIMIHLGMHENIVSFLGTVTGNIVNREVFIALELCPKGNLLHYLQRNCHQFRASWTQSVFTEFPTILNNGINPNETEMTTNMMSTQSEYLLALSTADLLEWSSQIANGMSYISSKNVIHGDLAARNILLAFNKVAKISDFGLSRQLAKYSVYQKTSKTPIPWKWLAIESLHYKTFSIRSDVWSFGVTLWEIFSLGKVPYPGKCWDKNFVNNLIAGERLESPEFANNEIYNLMLNCWKKEPTDRISFQEIFVVLSDLNEKMSAGITSSQRQSCIYTQL